MPTPLPVDRGIVWTLPQMHDLRFMRANYVRHSFKPHAHDYYVLGIIETGLQSFTHRKALHVTRPGRLIVINPGEVHTGEAAAENGFAYRASYPTVSLMHSILSEFHARGDRLPAFGSSLLHDEQLYTWFQQIHHRSEFPEETLVIDESLTGFLVTLVQRHSQNADFLPVYRSAPQAVAMACNYIEAYYATSISLDDLSKLVNISPYHFVRLFRRHMGMPPHKYLENVRIRHAERMLAAGTPIVDVAMMTGFSSQPHLTRTFKRFMGTTPGEFARQRKIV
ncbi:MAG: AraC family transcriptional regulator [Chloroflexota bacterium]